jgi:four helix bundle protein
MSTFWGEDQLKLNHKNLEAWKQSLLLIKEIYVLTKTFPKEELFGITSQLRRAAISVASNIAEGSSRKSSAERKRFYEIARSSVVEIDTQLEISLQIGYLEKEGLQNIESSVAHVFALLSGLLKSQNN